MSSPRPTIEHGPRSRERSRRQNESSATRTLHQTGVRAVRLCCDSTFCSGIEAKNNKTVSATPAVELLQIKAAPAAWACYRTATTPNRVVVSPPMVLRDVLAEPHQLFAIPLASVTLCYGEVAHIGLPPPSWLLQEHDWVGTHDSHDTSTLYVS